MPEPEAQDAGRPYFLPAAALVLDLHAGWMPAGLLAAPPFSRQLLSWRVSTGLRFRPVRLSPVILPPAYPVVAFRYLGTRYPALFWHEMRRRPGARHPGIPQPLVLPALGIARSRARPITVAAEAASCTTPSGPWPYAGRVLGVMSAMLEGPSRVGKSCQPVFVPSGNAVLIRFCGTCGQASRLAEALPGRISSTRKGRVSLHRLSMPPDVAGIVWGLWYLSGVHTHALVAYAYDRASAGRLGVRASLQDVQDLAWGFVDGVTSAANAHPPGRPDWCPVARKLSPLYPEPLPQQPTGGLAIPLLAMTASLLSGRPDLVLPGPRFAMELAAAWQARLEDEPPSGPPRRRLARADIPRTIAIPRRRLVTRQETTPTVQPKHSRALWCEGGPGAFLIAEGPAVTAVTGASAWIIG